MPSDPIPRCGDSVLHRPSGEEWVVAYADATQDVVAWAGWPNGRARLSDCTLVRPASDEQHQHWVQTWRSSGHDDGRRGSVLARYGTPEERGLPHA